MDAKSRWIEVYVSASVPYSSLPLKIRQSIFARNGYPDDIIVTDMIQLLGVMKEIYKRTWQMRVKVGKILCDKKAHFKVIKSHLLMLLYINT